MDLILYNGKISTMDRERPDVQAVAVENGVIAAVGASDEIRALKTRGTVMVDLGGARAVPGFNDSHLHILNYAVTSGACDLGGCGSVSEIVSRMRRHIEANRIPENKWAIGMHWNQDELAEQRFLTREDLDEISREHPVVCIRICLHVISVNTRMLEMMGLCGGEFFTGLNGSNAERPIEFRCAWAIGEEEIATGVFREAAADAIFDAIALSSADEVAGHLAGVGRELAQNGVTSLQSDDFADARNYEDVIAAYVGLARNGRLLYRVCQQRRPPDGADIDDFLSARHDLSGAEGFYKFGPIKLVTDGSLGARTALLSRPYNDDPSTCGVALHTQEELDYLTRRVHEAGDSVAVHCIGDGAIYMAMESICGARNAHNAHNTHKTSKLNKSGARHGIVHCQITDATLLDMFRDLDVIAYVQPIFLDVDLHVAESRVGSGLAATSYNFKTMVDSGVTVSLGTDCPVADLNPLENIYAAVVRKDLAGNPEGGFYPEQCLTVDEAVRAYTCGSAYCSREEDVKGVIREGYMADMAVLSGDIFGMDPDGIKDVKVDMTILNGKIVWSG